jgi:predicted nucleic acid-binding protein
VIYIDTSALAKFPLDEAESDALADYLRSGTSLTSSALTRAELLRTVRLHRQDRLAVATGVLRAVSLIAINDEILTRASGLDPAGLRTLDAIHLASALLLGRELEAFVAYDSRLLEAAAAHGIPTASPS